MSGSVLTSLIRVSPDLLLGLLARDAWLVTILEDFPPVKSFLGEFHWRPHLTADGTFDQWLT